MKQIFSIVFTLSLHLLYAQEKSADFLKEGLKIVFFEILDDKSNSEKIFEQDSTIYIISQNFFCLLNDSILQSNFVDAVTMGEIKYGNRKLVFLPYESLFLIYPNRYVIFDEVTFTSEGNLKLSFIIDGQGYRGDNSFFQILLAKSALGSVVISNFEEMLITEIENYKIYGLPRCH